MKGLALLSPRVSSPLLGTSRTSRSQSFCLLAAFFILALTTLIYLRSESLLDYLVAPAYQRFVMTPVDPSTAVDARPGWMPFQRPDEITFEPAFRPSLAQKVMSASCADDWVTRMEVCEEMRDGRVQKAMLEALHAVISWVNGTDAIMGASR